MKKSKGIISTLLAVAVIGGAIIGTTKLIQNINSKPKNAVVDFYTADTIYGDDIYNIVRNVSKNADYEISYYDAAKEKIEKPTTDGDYSIEVNIKESKLYKAGTFKKDFKYINTSSEKVAGYFHASADSWGGDASGTSVNCNVENVKTVASEVKLNINLLDDSSACLDSEFTMFDGTFQILFKTNLSDYGTFAFWLTGVSGEENTKDEVTIELTKDKAIFGSAKGDDYVTHDKVLDIDYANGYWHSLEIYYNHATPEAIVTMDGQVIHTFATEELPNIEYVKPHVGLLYPTNPKWTGEKTNKQVTASVANYKVFKVSGETQW